MKKYTSGSRMNIRRTAVTVPLLAAILCGYASLDRAADSYSDNVLRLHVIANSDSAEDQALKLKVRDKIGSVVSRLAADSESAAETELAVRENIGLITSAARQQVHDEGFDYEVRVETGKYYFPTRYYSEGALPAGEYEAVRVVIGSGEGANWWCVLFPPLCFSESGAYSETPEADEGTRENVNVRFKIVEIFRKAKHFVGKFVQKFAQRM